MTARRKSVLGGTRLVAALIVSWFAGIDPVNGQKLYWAERDTGTIFRSEMDGSGVEPVISVFQASFHSLTIDVEAGRLYWSEAKALSNGTWESSIRRSRLDGSDAETLFRIPQNLVLSLTIDTLHGHLYWVVRLGPKIMRSDLDGKNVENVLTGLTSPTDITLDPVGNSLYWTQEGGTELVRSRLDGSVAQVVPTQPFWNQPRINVVSFEPIGRDLYFVADHHADPPDPSVFIYRARPDGSEPIEIHTSPYGSSIHDLEFDRPDGMMYWVKLNVYPTPQFSIRRASLDGCGAEDVISEGLNPPIELAIDSAVRPKVDFSVGLCPNDPSLTRQPVTPVAALGDATLDVYKIDPQSIYIERTEGGRQVRPLLRNGAVTFVDVGSAAEADCDCGGSQPDGVLDAVFSFSTAELRRLSQPAPGTAGGPVQLVLRGRLNDGRPVVGMSCLIPIAD